MEPVIDFVHCADLCEAWQQKLELLKAKNMDLFIAEAA